MLTEFPTLLQVFLWGVVMGMFTLAAVLWTLARVRSDKKKAARARFVDSKKTSFKSLENLEMSSGKLFLDLKEDTTGVTVANSMVEWAKNLSAKESEVLSQWTISGPASYRVEFLIRATFVKQSDETRED